MIKFDNREDIIEFVSGRIKLLITAVFWVALIATPFISLMLKSILLNIDAFAVAPALSDELVYWRELYSFSEVGFDFGYSSTFLGNYAEISNLGNHGLSPYFAWGIYALLFEWGDNAIVIFSMVSFIISLIIFVATVRPKIWQSILMIVLILTSSYVNLYNSASMMEISVLAAVITAVALIINYERNRSRAALILATAAIIYCGLLRINYILLIFPLICIHFKKINLKLIIATAVAAVISSGIYLVTSLFTAPYRNVSEARFFNSSSHLMKAGGITFAIAFAFILLLLFLFITFVKVEGSFKRRDINVAFRFKIEYFGFTVLIIKTCIWQYILTGISFWHLFDTIYPILFIATAYLITRSSGERFIKRVAIPFVTVLAVVTSVGLLINIQMLPMSDEYDYKIEDGVSPISELPAPEGEDYADKTVAVFYEFLTNGDIYKHLPPEYGIIYENEPTPDNLPSTYEIAYIAVQNSYVELYPYVLDGYSYLYDINGSLKLYKYNS